MTDSSSDGREAKVSGSKSQWMQWGVLGAACSLVIGIYAFAAQSGPLESLSLNPADTYYNLLVQGFRAGQLSLKKEAPPGLAQLADPYDPAASILYRPASNSMIDMSYYKGKLYLYFGVTPALILFWPFAALTGQYLFHRQAVAIFCAIGFLASVGLLRALWRRYFAEVSVGVVATCMLALGLAAGLPVLMSRSDVYEVPISCGYMLTMLALGAIWRAVHEPEPRKNSGWLALASVAYGLAVGARPSLLFGAVVLLVPVIQAWRERRPMGVLLTGAAGPVLLIGLGLMLYNALRFDNPFEFGLRYELGPARMDRIRMFHLPYLWFNFRVYFLEPARWSSRFPFVNRIVVPPLPSGRGEVETPFGVLTNMPLAWLILVVPLACRRRSASACSILRTFLVAVALVFGTDAFVLCLFRGANFRYEVEFLPALMLLAVVGVLGLERAHWDRSVWRGAVRWGWGVLLGFSVAFNLLAGTVNCAEAQNNLGFALERTGKLEDALRHYELASRIKPDYAEAQYYYGVGLAQAGRIQEAIGHYELALRLKPDYAEAHNNLGSVLLQAGRSQEAMEHYNQALRIKPDFGEAHNNLGTALLHVGRVQEAIGHFEQALQINPGSADGHYNLGVALEQFGRVNEAIQQYEEVVRITPGDAEARDKLAKLGAWQAQPRAVR